MASSFTLCQHKSPENDEQCQEEQYVICPHCDLWVCIPHLLYHQQLLQTHTHIINDEANQIRQQLLNLSVDPVYEHCKQEIDSWKKRMYGEIDAYHTEMMKELNNLYKQLNTDIIQFQTNTIERFSQSIARPLSHVSTKCKQVHPCKLKEIENKMESIKQQIENINDKKLITMNLDEIGFVGTINFYRKYQFEEIEELSDSDDFIDLAAVKQHAIRYFPIDTQNTALAASDNFVVVFENPSTLVLFDTTRQLQKIEGIDNNVQDICWSDTMKMFFIAGNRFQTYDILSNALSNKILEHIDSEFYIRSVTAHHNDMFLLLDLNYAIARYCLPSFKQSFTWSSETYLDENNEIGVRCIRINSLGMLAMTVLQKDFLWRIDLFDLRLQRYRRCTPLIDTRTEELGYCMLHPLSGNEWLIMNNASKPQILSIMNNKGEVKQRIQKHGYNIVCLGTEYLALLDEAGLHLHQV